jgi:hypothetical protein
MRIFIVVFALTLCFASAEELPFDKPDIGQQIQKDRAKTGTVKPVPLGSTGYFATLLVSHYIDDPKETPQFVEISVQKKENEHSSVVYFERQFRAHEVPSEILTAKTKDIVTYGDTTRVVSFNLGMAHFDYRLPQR